MVKGKLNNNFQINSYSMDSLQIRYCKTMLIQY